MPNFRTRTRTCYSLITTFTTFKAILFKFCIDFSSKVTMPSRKYVPSYLDMNWKSNGSNWAWYIYSAIFSLCSYNGAVAQWLAYWLSVPEAGVQLLAGTLFKVSWKAVPFHYFSRKNSVERAYVLKWFIRNNSSTNALGFNKNQSKKIRH